MTYMLRAVVVGINEYGAANFRDQARLLFAQKDATAIATTLSSSTVLHKEPGNLHLLTNEQATWRAVKNAMNSTFTTRSFDRNTIALFYFAGHGVPRDNRIYLCCHDVDFTDPEHGGIRLNDVYDWLASSSAECAIAIIDACFSGGIVADRVDYLSAAEAAKQAIEALRGPDGKTMAIFAACRSDQTARESRRLKHGLFTYEIVQALQGGAAREPDGSVYLLGLANFLTQRFADDRQRPQITIRGGHPIALWKGETSSQPAQTPSSPAPNKPISMSSEAGDVYVQVTLPTAKPVDPGKRRQTLIFVSLAIITALMLCGILATVLFHH